MQAHAPGSDVTAMPASLHMRTSSSPGSIRPQASYLIFLDCRALGLNQEELNRLFVEDAHLALNDGTTFGKEGEGFMRLNVACPRATLEKALKQLEQAVMDLK